MADLLDKNFKMTLKNAQKAKEKCGQSQEKDVWRNQNINKEIEIQKRN